MTPRNRGWGIPEKPRAPSAQGAHASVGELIDAPPAKHVPAGGVGRLRNWLQADAAPLVVAAKAFSVFSLVAEPGRVVLDLEVGAVWAGLGRRARGRQARERRARGRQPRKQQRASRLPGSGRMARISTGSHLFYFAHAPCISHRPSDAQASASRPADQLPEAVRERRPGTAFPASLPRPSQRRSGL